MKKIKCKKGVTMVEMLGVILVLALIGGTMATGLRLAIDAYTRTVAQSEAQILCSTLSASLKNELRYAGSIALAGDEIEYFSPTTVQNARIRVVNGIVQLHTDGQVKDLVSQAAYSYGTKAALNIDYEETTNIFTVKLEIRDQEGELLAEHTFQVERLKEGEVRQ